jgi:hypothetical protein
MATQTEACQVAYEDAALKCQKLITRLSELVDQLPAEDDADQAGINWGHVGSLNCINEILAAVVKTWPHTCK